MDLDEVLGGSPKTETETSTAAAPAVTETPAVAAVETGAPVSPPETTDTSKLVPLSALDAERKGRKDWKEKALLTQGENALLKKQLEDALRGPPRPAEQEPQADEFPDPILDPQGYRRAVIAEARREAMSERLTAQEERVKEKHGDDEVEAAWSRFTAAAATNPALKAEIGGAKNPWVKLMEWDKRHQAQTEIGDDPVAYREKLREEIRKELAEQSGATPTPSNPAASPPFRIPQSLASTPSVAARNAPSFTGPVSLSDMFDRKH